MTLSIKSAYHGSVYNEEVSLLIVGHKKELIVPDVGKFCEGTVPFNKGDRVLSSAPRIGIIPGGVMERLGVSEGHVYPGRFRGGRHLTGAL